MPADYLFCAHSKVRTKGAKSELNNIFCREKVSSRKR